MPPSKRQRLFEQLGLNSEPEQANPLSVLGIDPEFARSMLQEDPSGAALGTVATAMHRVLSRRYHPDSGATSDTDRYKGITEARQALDAASAAAKLRWSKVERTTSSSRVKALETDRAKMLGLASGVLQTNFELSNRPEHFSQFNFSQGALLERGSQLFLMTRHENGLRVVPGKVAAYDKRASVLEVGMHAFDFQRFLRENDSFGLPAEMGVRAFIGGDGRASLLTPDLGFIMDITGPVVGRIEKRRAISALIKNSVGADEKWIMPAHPVLYTTTTPSLTLADGAEMPPVQIASFPRQVTATGAVRDQNWDLGLDVVGSYEDTQFFNRMRHSRTLGNVAIASGTRAVGSFSYFNVLGIATSQLVQEDASYSPLLTPGNGMLLFDNRNKIPVLTDVKIVGMIGNDSRAAHDV